MDATNIYLLDKFLTKIHKSYDSYEKIVLIVNSNGIIKYVNNNFVNHFKYNEKDVIFKNVKLLVAPDAKKLHDDLVKKFFANEYFKEESEKGNEDRSITTNIEGVTLYKTKLPLTAKI